MMFNSNTLLASVVASLALLSGVSAAVSASRDIALASNPVDACNGSNHYGVGHSCAFSTPDGTSQGTCQDDSSGDLVCIPNPARRDIALASNPVDACNGSNHYGVGHSCAFSTSDGTSQGTCQDDASGDLVCVPNSARRDIALADNPVDACNGSNDYGVGHSCAWQGGNEGTCQINASGVLTCVN